MAKVYTVGHSNRSLSIFINLLKYYNIKVIIDVRRFPKSTKYPHFNRENLSHELNKLSIRYLWLGNLLGGFRRGGYEEYMKTKDYVKGINRLISVIQNTNCNVAIMCSEKLWFKCHRRFISDTLVSEGIEVIHIIDKDKTYRHRLKRV